MIKVTNEMREAWSRELGIGATDYAERELKEREFYLGLLSFEQDSGEERLIYSYYGILDFGKNRNPKFKAQEHKNGNEEEIKRAEEAIKSLKKEGKRGEAFKKGWRLTREHGNTMLIRKVVTKDGRFRW